MMGLLRPCALWQREQHRAGRKDMTTGSLWHRDLSRSMGCAYICDERYPPNQTELPMPVDLPYSFGFLESATETLRAVAHPHRLLIVDMLYRQKALNVTEMQERLGIEQAVVSHHLRILKDRGVVNMRRDGKNSYYSLTHEVFYKIVEVMEEVLQ